MNKGRSMIGQNNSITPFYWTITHFSFLFVIVVSCIVLQRGLTSRHSPHLRVCNMMTRGSDLEEDVLRLETMKRENCKVHIDCYCQRPACLSEMCRMCSDSSHWARTPGAGQWPWLIYHCALQSKSQTNKVLYYWRNRRVLNRKMGSIIIIKSLVCQWALWFKSDLILNQ